MPQKYHPSFIPDNEFTTKLFPKEEIKFQKWAKDNKITDADHPESRYDYRGFFKETGGKPHPSGDVEHFPDTYKQPGHPTFSVESKYAKGRTDAGSWNGDTFVPAKKEEYKHHPSFIPDRHPATSEEFAPKSKGFFASLDPKRDLATAAASFANSIVGLGETFAGGTGDIVRDFEDRKAVVPPITKMEAARNVAGLVGLNIPTSLNPDEVASAIGGSTAGAALGASLFARGRLKPEIEPKYTYDTGTPKGQRLLGAGTVEGETVSPIRQEVPYRAPESYSTSGGDTPRATETFNNLMIKRGQPPPEMTMEEALNVRNEFEPWRGANNIRRVFGFDRPATPAETTPVSGIDWGPQERPFEPQAPEISLEKPTYNPFKKTEESVISEKPTAKYKYTWEDENGKPMPMYEVIGGESHGSDVSSETLKKMGIQVPEIPSGESGRLGPHADMTHEELIQAVVDGKKPTAILENIPDQQLGQIQEKARAAGLHIQPSSLVDGDLIVAKNKPLGEKLDASLKRGDHETTGRLLGYSPEDIAVFGEDLRKHPRDEFIPEEDQTARGLYPTKNEAALEEFNKSLQKDVQTQDLEKMFDIPEKTKVLEPELVGKTEAETWKEQERALRVKEGRNPETGLYPEGRQGHDNLRDWSDHEKKRTEILESGGEDIGPYKEKFGTIPKDIEIPKSEEKSQSLLDKLKDERGSIPVGGEKPKKPKRLQVPVSKTPEIPKTPVQSALKKLANSIVGSKGLREEQEALYKQERAKRFAAFEGVKATGKAGANERLGKLKGELPKLNIEELQLTEEEENSLFDAVAAAQISTGEKASGIEALHKLLSGGHVPQRSELHILDTVFGRGMGMQGGPGAASEFETLSDVLDAATDAESKPPKQSSKLRQGYELTRGLMSIDIPYMTSAAFRQGVGLAGTQRWFQAVGEQAKAFGDEAVYNAIMKDLENHPINRRRTMWNAEKQRTEHTSIADQIGLKISSLENLTSREEQIRSQLAERIPVAGRYVRASNRSYTTFLNSLRTHTAYDWIMAANVLDEHGNIANLADARRIGNTINELTGAASLNISMPLSRFTGSPKELMLDKSADTLSLIFFSPKLAMRDLRMMNPLNYVKYDKVIRTEYLKGALRRAAVWAGFTGLAALTLGATVSNNVTSSDFGKAKKGNTRADAGSGILQWMVLISRQALGKNTSSVSNRTVELGSSIVAPTRIDLLEQFLINRLHPTLGLGALALTASKNRPFYPMSSTIERITPMYTSDIHDIMMSDHDIRQIILGFGAGAFSMGSTTYGKEDYGKPQYKIPYDPKFEGGRFFGPPVKQTRPGGFGRMRP